jgi:DNA end-binding protein Ku
MDGTTLWKGSVHFGDTTVAVKLHPAVREDRIRFHLLHRRDRARLRQQMICAWEKKPVPGEEQARGFEVEEGKYIIVDPEELEQTAPESSRLIEVHEFVRTRQIDPLFLDRPYRLEPDSPDIQGKGYRALVTVLTGLDVAGICTWTMRKRSYFGALQARGDALRLSTLRYADEVIPARALELQQAALSEKELAIGIELIEKLTAPFEPEKFRDEHQKKLQSMIEKKARGEKIAILRPRRLKPTAPDRLLQVLQASLKNAA